MFICVYIYVCVCGYLCVADVEGGMPAHRIVTVYAYVMCVCLPLSLIRRSAYVQI